MNLPDLSWLKLSNNNLGGTIKDALQKSWSLFYLDISNNSITGELPRWIGGGNFSQLNTLSISKNDLQGRIPSEICKLNLQILDLSENNFTGTIPSCSNFSSLINFHLHKNRLTGIIPRVLSNCSSLKTLDLRDNQLSGGVPDWIDKLPSIVTLLLAGNNLHGHIPYSLCQSKNLNILDLSRNNLSGEIPTCLGNMSFGLKFDRQSYERWEQVVGTDEYVLDVSYMQYSKPEEVEFLEKNQYLVYRAGVLELMSGLDLSCNKLTGIIPSELGKLRKIRSLNISHNHLTGSIPSSFSLMNEIESLDLSSNHLSGTIPSQLVELSFLSAFNVSYNNLSGRVPVGGQFGTFDEGNYFGNPGLYGFPDSVIHHPPTASMPDSPTKREKYDDHAESYIADFLWTFGMSCAIMFLTTVAILYINPRCRRALFGFIERHVLWWMPTPWLSLY